MLRTPAEGGVAAWVPERPGAASGKVRGFHLSSLYSPLGWLSWDELVEGMARGECEVRAPAT
jgi:hypothetical protein